MVVAQLVSPPVSLHRLVTFQLGSTSVDVAFGLQVAALALYCLGVRRLARRGRRWSPGRTLSFVAGVAVLFVALVSGLASFDDTVFTVHVVQHLLIMMLAPPLLSLGAPITLALQASSRPVQSRLVRLLHSAPVALLSAPLAAGPLFYVSMWIDMESSFYPYSLTHPLVHEASHLVLFAIGSLFWWPVAGADRLPRPVHPGIRLAALGLGMPFESFLAIALMSARQTIAPEHALADVHMGGEVFWIGAMMITTLPAGVLAWRWLAAEQRAERRPPRLEVPAAEAAGVGAGTGGSHGAWEAEWLRRTGRVPPTVAEADDWETPERQTSSSPVHPA